MVSTNSVRPIAISALRLCQWSASPHWKAMTDGSESPDEKRLAVIVGDEPITSATAIVSPIARPRPSITAPTMPPSECGKDRAGDHLPPRRAERQRAVAIGLRRGLDHLAGDAR